MYPNDQVALGLIVREPIKTFVLPRFQNARKPCKHGANEHLGISASSTKIFCPPADMRFVRIFTGLNIHSESIATSNTFQWKISAMIFLG